MKENGIGRPSTRASIIETLFKRKYIERQKKLIIPTKTGIDLIDLIDNELLKSAELTGLWEKRLKEIERGEYHASTFIKEMKRMVDQLVYEVRSSKKTIRLSEENNKVEKSSKTKKSTKKTVTGKECPKCKNGKLLKGKTAFGCSAYKNGCDFKLPFSFLEKKISESQLIRLLDKGSTTNLKGWKIEQEKVEGLIRFDDNFNLKLEQKRTKTIAKIPDTITCPKCKKGTVLKGKSAYGCSEFKNGCDFVYPFSKIKEGAKGEKLTKELVYKIITT